MRYLVFVWLLFSAPCFSQTLWESAGLAPLCTDVQVLLAQGLQMPEPLLAHFSESLCDEFSTRLLAKIGAPRLAQGLALLQSPQLLTLTQAEHAAGRALPEELANYRAQLLQRPVRAERLALIRRLNQASLSSALVYQLRYQIGQTQAFWLLYARGQALNDTDLAALTQGPSQALLKATEEGVESFMLYAFRRLSSRELAEAIALYQSAQVTDLLVAANQVLADYFVSKRHALSAVGLQYHEAPLRPE